MSGVVKLKIIHYFTINIKIFEISMYNKIYHFLFSGKTIKENQLGYVKEQST